MRCLIIAHIACPPVNLFNESSMTESTPHTFLLARQRMSGKLANLAFGFLAHSLRVLPIAQPRLHRVIRERGRTYRRDPELTLDIYRPATAHGPLPVVFYVHGGAFQALSKETHWLMGIAFARRGYAVVNINYRLAPKHRFPAGMQDVCAAYRWMVENAEAENFDLSKIVVAGESAGANLITSLAIASAYPRPEPWAQDVYRLNAVPHVALPACGIMQVTDTRRLFTNSKLSFVSRDILNGMEQRYLPKETSIDTMLADPLRFLEQAEESSRPLPAFFLPVGTKDPIMDDTHRMLHALQRLSVPCQGHFADGGMHAFHVFVWRKKARKCWKDMLEFTHQHLTTATNPISNKVP